MAVRISMKPVAVLEGEPLTDEPESRFYERKNGTSEGAQGGTEHRIEPHVLAASLVLVAAVACEAATARDLNPEEADSPSSMRISSLVCLLALASPVIKGVNRIDQRSLVAAVLAALALSGLHQGSDGERGGDAYYTVIVLLLATQIVSSGGIESEETRPDAYLNKKGLHRKQTVSAFCGALFLYVGVRGLRAGFTCASEARGFSISVLVNGVETAARGYAGCNAVVTGALGFGYGVACAVGILILMSGGTHARGSSVVGFEVGMGGLAMAAAAGLAFLATSHGIEALPLLYNTESCNSGTECVEASRARRFALVNQSSAPLWMCALAALVYCFAVERRVYESSSATGERAWRRSGFGLSAGLTVAALASAFQFCTFTGKQWHTDCVILVCIFSIFLSTWLDVLSGMAIFASAMTVEQVLLLQNYGADHVFNHLTHISLFMNISFLWLFVVLLFLKEALTACFIVNNQSPFSKIIGCVTTFGTSLSLALFLASCVLLACSSGDLPSEAERFRDNSPKRFSLAFLLDHWMPLFGWLPAFACRCEVMLVPERLRASVWVLSAPVAGIAYFLSLSALGQSAPTAEMLAASTAVPVGFAAAVAWWFCAFV